MVFLYGKGVERMHFRQLRNMGILLFGLLFLSGCFEIQPQSDLLVTANDNLIESVEVERGENSENIFRMYFNKSVMSSVSYLDFGDVIQLEFRGDEPDFIYVTDSIISETGEYLYDKTSDMKIEYVKQSDSNFYWAVREHIASFRVIEMEEEQDVFRGIKIDAFFGEKKTTYIMVIRSGIDEK